MKRPLAWLFPLAAIAAILSFAFPPPILGVAIAIAAIGLFAAAGLYLGAKNGLGSSIPTLRRIGLSLLIGAATGALLLAILPAVGLAARTKMDAAVPLWQRVVMSFNAAVLEEIIFRLFIVSLVVWLLARVMRLNTAIWIGIVIAALAFGAVHLPRWITFGPTAMVAVVFVNGVGGIVLGRVYAKWGIEAAMITHFAADLVVHVAGPSLFA